MKFKIVLWVLGFMLERASKNNPRFKQKLMGQELTLEIGCEGGTPGTSSSRIKRS